MKITITMAMAAPMGLKLQIRLEAAPWNGWVSYTLSKSTRWNEGKAEEIFQYDQTHLLTVLGGVDVGRNWRLASRFRYVTGNPSTPITGAILIPTVILTHRFEERFIPHGCSRSCSLISNRQKWVYNRWILSVYLDIFKTSRIAKPRSRRIQL